MKRRIGMTSCALFIGALLVPGNAFAHALLTKSIPAADARLPVLPTMIRLWYSESPELAMTHVTLTDSLGHVVDVAAVERDESKLAVHVRVTGKLAAGRYTVAWKTAAADGHPSHGSFNFVVLPAAVHAIAPPKASRPPTDDAQSPQTAAYVAARALTFVAILAVIGVVAFRFLVLRRSAVNAVDSAALGRRTARVGVVASVLLCVAALGRLYAQASMMRGSSDSTSSIAAVILTMTQWGTVWMLQAIAALAALVGFAATARWPRHGWSLAVLAALALSVTSALSGHAGASPQWPELAVAADSLHVLGASGWLGSLLCLVAIGVFSPGPITESRAETARMLVDAFSPTALGFAALVVCTGTVSACLRVHGLTQLWTSTYGKVLLLKLGALSGVAGTGLYNWRWVRPGLGTETATMRLKRSAMTELAVGLLVLVVTAVLVATPTPLDVA